MSEYKKYMRIAIKMALKGRGKVEPNPLVGAVVVNNGKIVGRGYHEYFGGPHAEVNALSDAGSKAKGATLFVTLEPCSRWGKTPPCTEKIIDSGIKKVVCSMSDVNPENRKKGFSILRKNGVKVINEVLKQSASNLNAKYISSFSDKPFVSVKYAMTLDGKIAANSGDSRWISGDRSRTFVHKIRSRFDAILVGVGTVVTDNPNLTSHGRGKNPVRVIIDPGLRIPYSSKVLDNKAPKIIVYSKGSASKILSLRKKAILIKIPSRNGEIPFRSIIKKLSDISIRTILIEGGGKTIASALEASVVNEIYAFVAPKIIGGMGAKTPVEGTGISRMKDALKFRILTVTRIGGDVLIKGKIK